LTTFAPPQAQDHTVEFPAEVAHRMQRYLDAAKIADCSDFPGLVLMSLCFYVDDSAWEEALQDALRTIIECGARKKAGNA
jgi:hypothetical protein